MAVIVLATAHIGKFTEQILSQAKDLQLNDPNSIVSDLDSLVPKQLSDLLDLDERKVKVKASAEAVLAELEATMSGKSGKCACC